MVFIQKPETLPPIPLSRILLIIGTQQNPELERLNQMAILELDRPFVMQGLDLIRRKLKTNGSFLLSDGKPNDYDRYRGHRNTRLKQALRELNQRKINSYALAIEAQAKYYLPQMFGQNHYQILTSPEELVQSLVKLYKRIKYQ